VATSKVTHDSDEIISEIHIAAQPDRVFQALVDPEQVVKWWGQGGVYRCTEFAADLRTGGKWHSAGVGPDGGRFEVTGEYVEVDPPRVLAYTWIASWTGDVKTTVRWELEPTNQGTLGQDPPHRSRRTSRSGPELQGLAENVGLAASPFGDR
jgi:uncharacterized protein YndB with AHSA1/START domain